MHKGFADQLETHGLVCISAEAGLNCLNCGRPSNVRISAIQVDLKTGNRYNFCYTFRPVE
jgi:hypothetical protein